jgi:hypothetical protein
MDVSTSLCSSQNGTSCGIRAMEPSSFTISQSTPAGLKPASLQKSTPASVCPLRASTPPCCARSGNTCPGRIKSLAVVAGSARARKVAARSAAEIPVLVPFLTSVETVNAVPLGSSLSVSMGAKLSASRRSPGTCTAGQEPGSHTAWPSTDHRAIAIKRCCALNNI